MRTQRIRVLLCNKSKLLLGCMAALLKGSRDVRVVAEAMDTSQAVLAARQFSPEIAIIDEELPVIGGFALCRLFRHEDLPAATIVLHKNGVTSSEVRLREKDVDILMSLDSEGQVLLEAIRSMRQGTNGEGRPRRIGAVVGQGGNGGRLTERQKQVLGLIAAGYTNKEIATELAISPKTVEAHRLHIMERLDLHNAAELTRHAMNVGLIA